MQSSFGFGRQSVGLFAELDGMRLFTGGEQHWTRRDRLDVIEGVESRSHRSGSCPQTDGCSEKILYCAETLVANIRRNSVARLPSLSL